MADELKPCPRCGVWPEAFHDIERGKPQHYVGCCDCGISSKRFSAADEAAVAWNSMCDCCEPRTPSEPADVDEQVELVRPLYTARKSNRPISGGERIVGFVLPEEVAGLSDGLFMLDALLALAAFSTKAVEVEDHE